MWSYYGRKTKVVSHYPSPECDLIIEPFAGTAVYSLFKDNWKRDVILLDSFQTIISIWKFLQQASPKDILGLPDMSYKQSLDEFPLLSAEERGLIGFCINRGSSQPKKTAQKFNSWNKDKVWISENLHKIKHWDIRLGDFRDAPDIQATWFIDPPYQFGGKYYNQRDIDYGDLGNWAKSRRGQVIVCENSKANWMDFRPLRPMGGQLHRTLECIWTNR